MEVAEKALKLRFVKGKQKLRVKLSTFAPHHEDIKTQYQP